MRHGESNMKNMLAILAILIIAHAFAEAQFEATLSACNLVRTTFLTEGGHPAEAGGAATPNANTVATGPLLPSWNVTCPLPAGGVCTFMLQPVFTYISSATTFADRAWISPSIADKVGPDLNDSDDFVLPP